MVFIGSLLYAFFMALEDQVEIGVALFSLALGLDQLAVWFGPLFTVVCLYKIVNRHLYDGFNQTLNSMDIQNLNQLFGNLSTTAMIGFLVLALPWVPLVSAGGSFDLIEETLSLIFLENYKSVMVIQDGLLTGNIWSLVEKMQNGNFVSLLLYGLSYIYILFSLRNFNKKRVIIAILWQSLAVALFAIHPLQAMALR